MVHITYVVIWRSIQHCSTATCIAWYRRATANDAHLVLKAWGSWQTTMHNGNSQAAIHLHNTQLMTTRIRRQDVINFLCPSYGRSGRFVRGSSIIFWTKNGNSATKRNPHLVLQCKAAVLCYVYPFSSPARLAHFVKALTIDKYTNESTNNYIP